MSAEADERVAVVGVPIMNKPRVVFAIALCVYSGKGGSVFACVARTNLGNVNVVMGEEGSERVEVMRVSAVKMTGREFE